ncbi:MAG: uridine kinase [Actinomycetota bacterium]|nr:uridine kinase [Actinomycetota bacterium]
MSAVPIWRPLPPEAVPEVVAELIERRRPDHPLRVAMDGAEPWEIELLTRLTGRWIAAAGRHAIRVQSRFFLRPRSLRYEHGRTDPDSYYDWLDADGLRREVLDPLGPGGTSRFLPSLWDPAADRATRAEYAVAPPDAVVLVDGPLLLGRDLPFDLTVHVSVGAAALARRTPQDEHWTLPAFGRYVDEVDPVGIADVVIRTDDQQHPALLSRL